MMVRKAVVDAKTFSSALDQVSKVLRKSSIPVLAEALVSISDGQCTLTATDIETYLFQTVPARGDDLSFVFRKTKDVAKACRLFDGELELERYRRRQASLADAVYALRRPRRGI